MRTHIPKLMLLGMGGGIAAYMFSRRQSAAARAKPDPMAADPADPVQGFDELNPLQLDSLDVDAMSMVDSDVDVELASVESSIDEEAMELDPPEATTLDTIEQSAHDVGNLYGGHTPRAEDREHPDEDIAMGAGENWIEALEASATEYGPVAETELDAIVDDDDIYAPPHASDSEDTPVADRGSGGPGGI